MLENQNVALFTATLHQNKTLQYLNVNGCTIQDQEGYNFIRACIGLKELHICENLLKNESGSAILEVVQKNSQIKSISNYRVLNFKKNLIVADLQQRVFE